MDATGVVSRRLIVLTVACAMLSMLFAGVYLYDNRTIKMTVAPKDALYDMEQYFYGIDQPYTIENDLLTLTGYAVRRDEDLNYIYWQRKPVIICNG